MTQLASRQVQFADGSTVESDAIICCTGYTLQFPFLPAGLVEVKDNCLALYQHVFPPEFPNLAFVGFCSITGSHIPVAELQGRWVAAVLAGRLRLPTREQMAQEMVRFRSHPSEESPIAMQVQLRDYAEGASQHPGSAPAHLAASSHPARGGSAPFRQPIIDP